MIVSTVKPNMARRRSPPNIRLISAWDMEASADWLLETRFRSSLGGFRDTQGRLMCAPCRSSRVTCRGGGGVTGDSIGRPSRVICWGKRRVTGEGRDHPGSSVGEGKISVTGKGRCHPGPSVLSRSQSGVTEADRGYPKPSLWGGRGQKGI